MTQKNLDHSLKELEAEVSGFFKIPAKGSAAGESAGEPNALPPPTVASAPSSPAAPPVTTTPSPAPNTGSVAVAAPSTGSAAAGSAPPPLTRGGVPATLRSQASRKSGEGAALSPRFDDLFTYRADATPAAGGTADDKVAVLRERLKSAEAQIARLREAWTAKEAETAQLERRVRHEQSRATQSGEQARNSVIEVEQLRAFIEGKKAEMQAYHQRVEGVVARQRDSDTKLRSELEQLNAALVAERTAKDELAAEVRRLEADTRQAAVIQAEGLRHAASQIEAMEKSLAASRQEIARLEREASDTAAAGAKGRALDEEAKRELDKRDGKITFLQSTLDEANARLLQFDAELRQGEEALAKAEAQRQETNQELVQSWETLSRARQETKAAETRAARLEKELNAARQELTQAQLASAPGPALDPDTLEKLRRALGLIDTLVTQLRELNAEAQDALLEAGVEVDGERAGGAFARLKRALGIARGIVDEL